MQYLLKLHWFFVSLLLIAGIMIASPANVNAQDSTYIPTPGLDKVKAAVSRLERKGGQVGKRNWRALLAEGKAILAHEQKWYEGKMPIQRDIKSLTVRIEAFNKKRIHTQEEANILNTELKTLKRRAAKINQRLINRYAAFTRKTNAAFVAAVDIPAVKTSVSKGARPPFTPTWNVYQYRRGIAKGLAPDENRCAIVLSMTLGLRPRKGEASLKDVKKVIPEVKGADIANTYVRAHELADRLKDDWGRPQELRGAAAAKTLRNKKGIIFFDGGYGAMGRASHIDLWNGKTAKLGAGIRPAFKQAKRIWFWETK